MERHTTESGRSAEAEQSSLVLDEVQRVKQAIAYVGARSFPRKKGGRYNVAFLNTYMPPNEDGEEFNETGEYGTPVFSEEQEYFAFRKMNYLKFAALQEDTMIDIQSFLQESQELRETIARANMPLVNYMARIVGGGRPFYDELISEGSMILFELIETYEPAKGRRFIDYAAPKLRSKLRNKLGALRRGHIKEAPVEPNDLNMNPQPEKKNGGPLGGYVQSVLVRQKVSALLSALNEREQKVIIDRFNLHYAGKRTLKEIGEDLGLTRERVRQIEAEALAKLMSVAETSKDDRSMPIEKIEERRNTGDNKRLVA